MDNIQVKKALSNRMNSLDDKTFGSARREMKEVTIELRGSQLERQSSFTSSSFVGGLKKNSGQNSSSLKQ
jgi:hypothetical protein